MIITDDIIEKYFKTKSYLHIDRRIGFNHVFTYVTNNKKIALHSFLPLIHYIDETVKYTGIPNEKLNRRPVKLKSRDIKYAGHLDGYIYKYYSLILNEKYNDITKELQIDNCALAYRNNKPNKSNINFAAEVINSLVELEEAYILVGDFTHFFDEINHQLLKEKLKETLKIEMLPQDWYNIYRSLTRYGYYEKNLINEYRGQDKKLMREKKNSYFKNIKEFREFQKENKPQSNKSKKGIPQGTAMSGVLANVMAIDFDKELNQIAKEHSGIYRRYSDDFILIIPRHQTQAKIDFEYFTELTKKIDKITKENHIKLQPEKTEVLFYSHGKVTDKKGHPSQIDYLGFIFNGKDVNMRSKSIYKFYRQAYHLIVNAQKVKDDKGLKNIPYRRRIYSLYTDLGRNSKPHGNFITYAKNSQNIFDKISPKTNNQMLFQMKNRKRKIEKKLGVKIHSRLK